MSNYSVAQVESLTGIKAHTLRIWERRYNIISPMRTKTNIRYYSDEQLRKLLNISILLRNNYRISKLDKMSDDEINQLVTDISSGESVENKDEIDSLSLSMLNMNESAFSIIFERQVLRKGLMLTIKDLIYPFLNHIGILWGSSKVMPIQEHFISNLIRQKIIAAIETLPTPPASAPGIMLFLTEGEHHEIGLLLASFIAKDRGWKVYYMGQNVPLNNISPIIEMVNPTLMMTMFVTHNPVETNKVLRKIKNTTSVPLLVTGNPGNFKDDTENYLANPEALIARLSN